MTPTREIAALTRGLRALVTLAVLAPVDPGAFARGGGLGLAEAAVLLRTFEAHGFARRVPGEAVFVLTDLALKIVGSSTLPKELAVAVARCPATRIACHGATNGLGRRESAMVH